LWAKVSYGTRSAIKGSLRVILISEHMKSCFCAILTRASSIF
jgi:hypothetical protein